MNHLRFAASIKPAHPPGAQGRRGVGTPRAAQSERFEKALSERKRIVDRFWNSGPAFFHGEDTDFSGMGWMEDRDTDTGTTGGSVKAESKGRINSPIYQGYDHSMIRNLLHEPESCHLVVVTVIRNLAQFRNSLCSEAHCMNTRRRCSPGKAISIPSGCLLRTHS